jgi:NIMA-interacting peptidyl-prolyl cis-trans isomerase 4
MAGKKKEDNKKNDSNGKDAKGKDAKGKGGETKDKGGGAVKGAQSINVRHILVSIGFSRSFISGG